MVLGGLVEGRRPTAGASAVPAVPAVPVGRRLRGCSGWSTPHRGVFVTADGAVGVRRCCQLCSPADVPSLPLSRRTNARPAEPSGSAGRDSYWILLRCQKAATPSGLLPTVMGVTALLVVSIIDTVLTLKLVT